MKEYAIKLQFLDNITSKSKFSERDAVEIGEIVNQNLSERYRKVRRKTD